MELKKYKLEELCKLSSAKRIFEDEYVHDGVPFIRGQEVSDKSILDENAKFDCCISQERYNEIRRNYGVPQKGDILMTAVGTIGNLIVLNTDRQFYFKDGNIIRFSDFAETVCSDWLAFYMQSSFFKKQIENQLIGAVQKALTMVMLNKTEILLPPIEYQRKIASILSSFDKKIALNRSINQHLEALAKQFYDYWFVQFDFPNAEGKPYKSSGGKMVWNEQLKREIPEGWDVVSVNDIADSYRGVSYTKDDLVNEEEGLLVLRGNNIQGNQLTFDSNVAYIPKSFVSDEQRIKKGHIIMTMSSGSKEHVGKCVLFHHDAKETYGAFLTKFVPHAFWSNLLYGVFNSDYFKAKIKSIASGTGINNLTNQTFDNIFIAMPPLKLLQQYDALLTQLFDEVGNLQQNTWNLIKLRDELLPLLMNGQVTVK